MPGAFFDPLTSCLLVFFCVHVSISVIALQGGSMECGVLQCSLPVQLHVGPKRCSCTPLLQPVIVGLMSHGLQQQFGSCKHAPCHFCLAALHISSICALLLNCSLIQQSGACMKSPAPLCSQCVSSSYNCAVGVFKADPGVM
jgi:hypothetical protein